MIATPTELRNFIELFRTKHLTRAAIKLAITQPGLTQSMLSLERKIGSQLFYRTKQGMLPTPHGEYFFEEAQVLLDQWSKIETKFRISREGLHGRFKIGAHQSVASYCMPRLLEKLDHHAPKIELELIHDFSRKITEKIVGHELDLGFVVNPVRHPDLVLKKIGTDEVRFWVAKHLSNIPKRLICDLTSEQLDKTLKSQKTNYFNGWTLTQTPSLEVVRAVTLAGRAIGFFPKRVALLNESTLTAYKPNQFSVYRDEIYLAYRKDRLTSAAGKALLECARIQLPE